MEDIAEYIEKLKTPKRVHKPNWTEKNINVFNQIREALCPGFIVTPEINDIYLRALKYYHSDESCGWDLNKGIYLYGVFGVGKTLFFRAFKAYTEIAGRTFSVITSDQLASRFAKYGFESIDDLCVSRKNLNCNGNPINLFIDDVGQGANSVKYYGSSTNIIVEILQRRYRCLIEAGFLTHISTNLEPREIKELYGEYINSRMKEMFNPVLFPGKDKRK